MTVKNKTARLLAILTALLLLSVFVFAADSGYNSADDPLISKSYLDLRLEELNSEIGALKDELDSLKASYSGYVTVPVKEGQTIYAKEENFPIEIIVRTGAVKVVSPFNDPWTRQGLYDISVGVDVYNGEYVEPYHVILIPKNDGRGVTVLSSDAHIMVRGSYVIE